MGRSLMVKLTTFNSEDMDSISIDDIKECPHRQIGKVTEL